MKSKRASRLLWGVFNFVEIDYFKVSYLSAFSPDKSELNLPKKLSTNPFIYWVIFAGSLVDETKIKYKPKTPLTFSILALKK